MKNILFVINTLGRGGAERALISLLSAFDSKEYNIDLFVLLGQGELIDEVPAHVHVLNKSYSHADLLSKSGKRTLNRHILASSLKHGAALKNLPYMISNFSDQRKANALKADKLAWKMVSDAAPRIRKEYDLAVAFIEGGSTYYVADWVNAKKKAAVLHIDYKSAGYTRKLDHGAYKAFDQLFGVSEDVVNVFTEVYPELSDRISVLPNRIDLDRIKRLSLEAPTLWKKEKSFRLLTVCRLVPQKRLEISIEAAKKMADHGLDFEWLILGEGEERTKLQRMIDEAGLTSSFVIAGVTDNPYPYYRTCDLYVHCTAFEGKSIAVQEALFAGCPVVLSDVPGNHGQITDGIDGRMVEFTPDAIADCILKLTEDEESRKSMSRVAALKKPDDSALEKITAMVKNDE